MGGAAAAAAATGGGGWGGAATFITAGTWLAEYMSCWYRATGEECTWTPC